MNNPQPSSEESGSGYDFHINCCPVYQYARSPSDVKPLPPSTSTAPLALEERVSSTRSKGSIGLFRNLSRAASTHDGEQPNIDVQRSRSTSVKAYVGEEEEEEEGPEAGQVSDIIQPCRTRSVQSQRGVRKSHSTDNTQSDSFASVQGGDEENIDNNSAVVPFWQDEQQARQSWGRCNWKKRDIIASACVLAGLCAIVIGLSLTTDSIVTGYSQKYGLTGDRDRDGVGDELEEILGLDPSKYDTNGDGKSDGEEVALIFGTAEMMKTKKKTSSKAPKTLQSSLSPLNGQEGEGMIQKSFAIDGKAAKSSFCEAEPDIACGETFTNEKVDLSEDLICKGDVKTASNPELRSLNAAITLVGPKAVLDCKGHSVRQVLTRNAAECKVNPGRDVNPSVDRRNMKLKCDIFYQAGILLKDGATTLNCKAESFYDGILLLNGGKAKNSEAARNSEGIFVQDDGSGPKSEVSGV